MLAARSLLQRQPCLAAAEAVGLARRLQEQQQQCGEWLSTSASAEASTWILVQHERGSSTTAAGGSTGTVQLQRRYDGDKSGSTGSGSASLSLGRLRQAVLSQLQATFLPSGYPETVAPGYLRNTLWQAAHHTAGSINGVLASTFLLYSVGLGAGAVPTAGALNWVLKDGLGQMGTLLFGKTIAHNFDVSPRAWYLLASAKLNLAMGLEICTMLLPAYFLPMGALANAIKGLSWMAGGSTKSVFKVSFAADNNFGDVSAKATSQTICASILGTSAGVVLASQIGQSVGLALGCYISLAAVHLYTGYLAVRCVPLATLNPSRLELLIRLYLQQQQQDEEEQQQLPDRPGQAAAAAAAAAGLRHRHRPEGLTAALPTPPELAAEDPVFHQPSVCIGTPLHKLVQQHGSQLGQALKQQQQQQQQQHPQAQALPQQEQRERQEGEQHAAAPPPPLPRQLHLLVPAGNRIHLLLHERAEAADCILGLFHACLMLQGISGNRSSSSSIDAEQQQHKVAVSKQHLQPSSSSQAEGMQRSLAEARRLLPGLLAALEASGWDDQKVVLEAKRRRCTW